MRIGQTSFLVFISKLASSTLGFVATLYFARTLGAEVLGYFALALTVAKWLGLVGEVGILSAATKRISEGEQPGAYFTASLIIVICVGTLTSIGLFIFRKQVNAYIGTDVVQFVILILIIGLVSSLVSSGLQGQRSVHISGGLLPPLRVGSQSLIQIVLVSTGLGLSGMLLGHALGSILVSLLGVLFLSLSVQRPRIEHFRSLFDFAKFSWIGSLRGRAFNDVDLIVLGAFVSPALVGIYSIAWNLTGFIGAFGSSIEQTTFPELSLADAESRTEEFANVVSDSLAYTGLFAIPGLFGAVVIADRLLRIYGEQFSQGAAVLALLILAMIFWDYQNQLLTALNAIDRPDLSFRVNLVFVVVNLCLNVILVLTVGWIGAALATVVSAIIGLILAFWYLHQLVAFQIPYVELGQQLTAALIMAAIVATVRASIEAMVNDNWIIVFSLVGLGAGAYFLVLLSISRSFRTMVINNFPFEIPFSS